MIQSSLKIILGSSSIYRAKLLSRYVSNFESIAPEIDESQYANESPQDLSMRLAKTKARKIADIKPQHVVIGSDQVVSFKKINIGKKIPFIKIKEKIKCTFPRTSFSFLPVIFGNQ